jgi:hypothetical protein
VVSAWGTLRILERLSRPLGSDHDGPLDETTNPYEPSLTDDELVMTRQLIEERFGDQTAPARGTAGSGGEVSGTPPSLTSPRSDDVVAEWIGNAVPVIGDVLASHQPHQCIGASELVNCGTHPGYYTDRGAWRAHVAALIANALAPQPK